MPNFNTLLNTYFLQPPDAKPPTEPLPRTFAGCRITPLIDGAAYFAEVANALNMLTGATGEFVLIAGWWLGLQGGTYKAPDFWSFIGASLGSIAGTAPGPNVVNNAPLALDGPGGTQVLHEILKQKAQAGVDVRVMGFVHTEASGSTLAELIVPSIPGVNAFTMESIKKLRDEPAIGNKAILNVIGHSAGGAHTKLVIVGMPGLVVGFTGGIDLVADRYAHPGHAGGEIWHDVAAKVEGPAVQALYDWFKDMWSENISHPAVRFRYEGADMPSFLPGTPVLPAHILSPLAVGPHHVQSLRTVPQLNYAWYNCLAKPPEISFAPQGCFEVRAALRKALRAAQTYVHIEDQSFWARETLSWVNEAIKARPDLRVILVTGGAKDPNDPEYPGSYLCNAVNHGLLEGLTPTQVNQVRLFKRFGDPNTVGPTAVTAVDPEGSTQSRVTLAETTAKAIPEDAFRTRGITLLLGGDEFHVTGNPAIPAGGNLVMIVDNLHGFTAPVVTSYLLKRPRGVFVHCKIYLVDDVWAVIGSANTMRRSLYTDLEHSVAVMDEGGTLVSDFRQRLYADHFRHPNPADFADIAAALHAWEPTWGTAPPRRRARRSWSP